MTKRLTLAFSWIALAFAAAAPLGAQGAREVAMSKQSPWCPEQPNLVVRQSLQDRVDLEPHHAAVLAACAEQAAARWEPPSDRFASEMAATTDR
jgi:uncharacterized protein (DUF1499 family)